MSELLYLDTARLGQMSPSARRASIDFARFASEYGCSLYLSEFLAQGFKAWPASLRAEFPGLADWNGVGSLKNQLRHLVQARQDTSVLVAARSASLMKLGARLLFGLCRHVLTTDLTWKPYERILRHEQPRRTRRITKIAIRRDMFRLQPSSEEIVERIAAAFRQHHCDGLFLPLVDCFGVKLPVAEIVARIRAENELRFVAVDGAQAINHVPIRLASDYCDFLVAGCHKWLHSFTPMGVGFFGRRQTVDYIESSLARWSNQRIIDDPLLTFTNELETGRARRFGESVVVSPMITANAAITDSVTEPENVEVISENRRTIQSIVASNQDWSRVLAGDEATSRIMMLGTRKTRGQQLSPDALRRRFHANGIAVSTYRRGRVRISVPGSPLRSDDVRRLESAFSGCNAISA
jgi:hypothetical protein